MLGSGHNEYAHQGYVGEARLYSVRVLKQTLWGWERRSDFGECIARGARLFPDYVACLCDALRNR